jgi:carbohydrate-selective porin OprB
MALGLDVEDVLEWDAAEEEVTVKDDEVGST